MMNKTAAIIPAAGLGKRFGEGKNKSLSALLGKPLLIWVLEAFEKSSLIDEIILVLKQEDMEAGTDMVKRCRIGKVRRFILGGKERQDSVRHGLTALESGISSVVIHDGARPLVDEDMISKTLLALNGCDGVIVGVPVKDTIKEAHNSGLTAQGKTKGDRGDITVNKTLDRSVLWSIQTPQAFHLPALLNAHEKAHAERYYGTDDAALVERYGGIIRIVMGSYRNIKITTPEDICVAEALLKP